MIKFSRLAWWKPWNWSTRKWLVAIFICILLSPCVSRWICLWQVPDVALPYDVEDVIRADVPEEQDAFVCYANAVKLLHQNPKASMSLSIENSIQQFEVNWHESFDQWLIESADVLAEYRRAGEMDRASGLALNTVDPKTALLLPRDFRDISKLAEAEAIRLERLGNADEAWIWHRANLRAAHHCEVTKLVDHRLVAKAIRFFACRGITRWAEQPSLTAKQLRAARQEVSFAASARPSMIDIVKSEYLWTRNTLNRSDAPNEVFPEWNTGSACERILLPLKRLALWSIGQPEITLRLMRQLMVNNADQFDKPLHLRRKVLVPKGDYFVFELDPDRRRIWGQIQPEKLKQTLEMPVNRTLALNIAWAPGFSDTGLQSESARFSMVIVVLAVQEYQKDKGEFPASLDQLMPDYLDAVPFDPMDATGTPLRYRREDSGEALIWSVGYNGINDDGDIRDFAVMFKDTGYRIRLNLPDKVSKKNDAVPE